MSVPAANGPTQLLAGARVVTPDGVREDAAVRVAGDVIAAVEGAPSAGRAGDTRVVDLAGAWLLPGYVDLHMHGGGGHSVAGSLHAMDTAVSFHRARGTTSTLVSLMTAPVDDLRAQLAWYWDPIWRARSCRRGAAAPRTRPT
jgi:N-acetylglucosamine-6-phosphate deacetylase